MKRYLIFTWMDYKPSGGINDLDSAHDKMAEVLIRAEELKKSVYVTIQVYDVLEGKDIYNWRRV